MKKLKCKYCNAKTSNLNCICFNCNEKLKLIREIKAMLSPLKKTQGEELPNGHNKDVHKY